jgi:tRNA(Ile)-lysidine synthase
VAARRVDARAEALPGESLEMTCRRLRRAALADLARAAGADIVALGHHRRDQAETVLLRLCRGTGLAGLGAMDPVRHQDGLVWIRPLLDADPVSLRAALQKAGHTWREDASNASPDMLRNRLRHGVLPALEREINPASAAHLAALATEARETAAWLESVADALLVRCSDGNRLHLAALRREPAPPARLALLRWLARSGVAPDRLSRQRVDQLLAATRARADYSLPQGLVLSLKSGWISLANSAPATPTLFRHPLPAPGSVSVLREIGVTVKVDCDHGFQRAPRGRAGDLPATVWLPAERAAELFIRAWLPGDRLSPVGATGSRLLSDLFTDARLPREARALVPVLAAASGVVWVPGGWLDRAWAVSGPRASSWRVQLSASAAPG